MDENEAFSLKETIATPRRTIDNLRRQLRMSKEVASEWEDECRAWGEQYGALGEACDAALDEGSHWRGVADDREKLLDECRAENVDLRVQIEELEDGRNSLVGQLADQDNLLDTYRKKAVGFRMRIEQLEGELACEERCSANLKASVDYFRQQRDDLEHELQDAHLKVADLEWRLPGAETIRDMKAANAALIVDRDAWQEKAEIAERELERVRVDAEVAWSDAINAYSTCSTLDEAVDLREAEIDELESLLRKSRDAYWSEFSRAVKAETELEKLKIPLHTEPHLEVQSTELGDAWWG